MSQIELTGVRQKALQASAKSRDNSYIIRAMSVIGFFLVWEVIARAGIFSPVLLPPPSTVLIAAKDMFLAGMLLPHIATSLARVCAGFFLATIIAVPLGIVCGWYHALFHIVDPIVELFRPIPVLALLPLAILWFGIGESSKIFLITYGAFFPIFVNTIAGVRYVDPVLVQAAESLGATKMQIFRRVILMAAMPDIATGLRLGLGFSFLTIVAAEMIASQRGLGFLIVDTQLTFQTDRTLVATLMFGVLGFLMGALLLKIEVRLLRWKKGLRARTEK